MSKSRKDIRQSELLLEFVLEERPGSIRLAWDAVDEMPDKFKEQLLLGLKKINSKFQERLSNFLKIDLS